MIKGLLNFQSLVNLSIQFSKPLIITLILSKTTITDFTFHALRRHI